MNLKDFIPLSASNNQSSGAKTPLVSVCIPARNEEKVIERAVCSVLHQNYHAIEILVLDDQSSDATSTIVHDLKNEYPKYLSVISGEPKPENWLGKSWACHQLSQKAKGDILFFIDADTWLEPRAVARTVSSLNQYALDFLTIWPLQKLETFWEKIVIPLVYYGLLSLLPARYVYKNPRWLPSSLEHRFAPYFAAACGQCMVFRRTVYKKIGGHQAVKNYIVEDVALARRIKRCGFSMRMFHGKGSISCRMYSSGRAMWHGFRKNFLALFGNSVYLLIITAVLNLIIYVSPFIIFIIGIFIKNMGYIMLSLILIIIIYTHRLLLNNWYNWNKGMVIFHPLGVLWFTGLVVQVLKDYWSGKRAPWKSRPT